MTMFWITHNDKWLMRALLPLALIKDNIDEDIFEMSKLLIPKLILENLCAGLLPRDKEESHGFAVARQGFLTQYLGSRTSRKFKN